MLFNSIEFIFLFLPLVLVGFWTIRRTSSSLSLSYLLVFSIFFYGYWKPIFLIFLLSSILVNFLFSKKIDQGKGKIFYLLGLILNLLPLFFFKYINFTIESLNFAFSSALPQIENIILPLAISFYTFQQIAYLSDCYFKGNPRHDLKSYALFVCFFPQLIAGPIVHHKELIPQFHKSHSFKWEYINIGLFIFSIGLFKKVVLADNLSPIVSDLYDQSLNLNFLSSWVGSLSYSLQLYLDFSGYSDMAIGLGKTLGINIPTNFNSPYFARNLQEFWRRWHITLGRWLKDYIYIPLGGNKKGISVQLAAAFATFLIGGLWHGAGWNFVIWGVLHGLGVCLIIILSKYKIKAPLFLALFINLLYVHIGWIFFRAHTFDHAIEVIYSLFNFGSPLMVPKTISLYSWSALGLSLVTVSMPWNSLKLKEKFKPIYTYLVFACFLFLSSLLFLGRNSEFLYFQF